MNISDVIQMVAQNAWIYGGSLILILSILVFVHEWGHYIIARMCGVRVLVFSIGFGKEIWGFYDKAGTRWKISMIPLGGYVQMFGDTDPASAGQSDSVEGDDGETREMTDEEKEEAFFSKPVWQRAAIVFAGPAINYIFAIMLLAGVFVTHGQPVSPPVAVGILGGSSAAENGFQPHDMIIAIDNKQISKFNDIRREMMVALDLEKHFVVKRGEEIVDIYAKPQRIELEDRFGFPSSIGRLGVIEGGRGLPVASIVQIDGKDYEKTEDVVQELQNRMNTTFTIGQKAGEGIQTITIHPYAEKNEELGKAEVINQEVLSLSRLPKKTITPHTMMTALQSAIVESYVMTRTSLEALWQMVAGVRSAKELGGIVRIGAVAGDMAQQGIVPLILLGALLSINLGFINLLPIPMLDGGHLLFYGVESVIGRPIPEQVQDYAFRAGFVFLIGIMAFANLNDVYQLLT